MNVAAKSCGDKHKIIWRALGFLLAVSTLLTTCVGWSLLNSDAASVRARDTQSNLDVHTAAQNKTLEHIDYRLERIDKSLEKVVESIGSNH